MLSINPRLLGVFASIGILISIGFAPPVAHAQLANSCTISSVQSFAPVDMTIATATDVAAAGTLPEYCDVTGSVTTTGFGAPDGSAKFEEVLPANWNHKFLYFGCGGLCGTVGHPQSGATGTEGLSKGIRDGRDRRRAFRKRSDVGFHAQRRSDAARNAQNGRTRRLLFPLRTRGGGRRQVSG